MIKEKEIMKKGFMVVLLVLLAGAMVFAEEPQKLTVKLEVVSTDWYGFTDSKIEDFTTDLHIMVVGSLFLPSQIRQTHAI